MFKQRKTPTGQPNRATKIWQKNVWAEKSVVSSRVVLRNRLSHIFLPIHVVATPKVLNFQRLAVQIPSRTKHRVRHLVRCCDRDRLGKKMCGQKHQAAAQTLFFQIVFPSFFCPSIFLPLSSLLPVVQSRLHPDSADSLKLSFDGPFCAIQFAGNFGIRSRLKLQQHNSLHRVVR